MSGAIAELAELLGRLPGIGRRSATRLAFHLLKANRDYVGRLGESIGALHDRVRRCSICANVGDEDPCAICADPARARGVICVVEGVPDLWAIEEAGTFHGRYHVLHGLLKPLDGVGPAELNLATLRDRAAREGTTEVIVATRPSVEGEATALLVKQSLAGLSLRVTRIASGVPHGSELEYADGRTLVRALDDRRDL
jgi:recombination protein RecR